MAALRGDWIMTSAIQMELADQIDVGRYTRGTLLSVKKFRRAPVTSGSDRTSPKLVCLILLNGPSDSSIRPLFQGLVRIRSERVVRIPQRSSFANSAFGKDFMNQCTLRKL
jgi:hypothetical protein